MSDYPQGIFLWNGIQAVKSCSYTLSHGTTPGIASIYLPPQTQAISPYGTLTIQYGITKITFPRCKIIKFDAIVGSDGKSYWACSIADERINWQFGTLLGRYNVKNENGFLRNDTAQLPQALLTLMFNALKVKANVSALPNTLYPEVDWYYAHPNLEISSFVSKFGCRVAYQPNGITTIVKTGIGANLPNGAIKDYNAGFDPAERPDSLIGIGNPSEYTVDFPLEAVGCELNGQIKKINNLSYIPPNGWGACGLGFTEAPLNGPNKVAQGFQPIAQSCIWRWYRPKLPFNVGGYNITTMDQILPMKPYQLVPTGNLPLAGKMALDGISSIPPWIYGAFQRDGDSNVLSIPNFQNINGNLVVAPKQFVSDGFSFDPSTGIVKFNSQTFRTDTDPNSPTFDKNVEPNIFLRVTTSVRGPNGNFIGLEVPRKLPPPLTGTQPGYVRRSDIGYRVWIDFNTGNVGTNLVDYQKSINAYLDEQVRLYQTVQPIVATYAGYIPIVPDGAIQSVTWWTDDDGRAYTRASWNNEPVNPDVSYTEKRFFDETARLIAQNIQHG